MSSIHDRGRTLRTALRGNAVFSGLSGAALVVGGGPVAEALGTGGGWTWAVRAVGLGLVGYAAQLAAVSRQDGAALRAAGLAAVVGDAGWVTASAVGLVVADVPGDGTALVVAVAAVVGLFAGWQALGVARLGSEDQPILSSGA